VGVLLDSLVVTRHVRELIEQVRTTPAAALTIVIVTQTPLQKASTSLLFRLYAACDRRLTPGPDPLELVDGAAALAGVPVVTLADLASLVDSDLAVLLDLRRSGEDELPLASPPHGVWRLRYGRDGRSLAEPGCF